MPGASTTLVNSIGVFPRLWHKLAVNPYLRQIVGIFKSFNFTIERLFLTCAEEFVVLNQLDAQRLLALFFMGGLFFNFPLLGLWDHDATWFGVPLFPLALFSIWLLLIVLMAWLMERSGQALQDD